MAMVLSALLCPVPQSRSQPVGFEDLALLRPGRTKADNALWIENELSARFNNSKRVVVADLKGPGTITMVHFAVPQSHFGQPLRFLNRDVLLRAFWDGETNPSVDVPLVDFFCDPNGTRDSVNTALVNKRRGFNAYFPMPFRQSARLELVYDGPIEPGDALWRLMPCYSYVTYRLAKVPEEAGYFHASWRQEGLLLGKSDYLALDAQGRGRFVGWNVTVRSPGRDGYPVDENEKFYIDGESTPSIEFQGLEDSFGFSWGFPETDNSFPLTGYFKFMKGAAAYRFFTQDAIEFEKSLRVLIGFGKNEDPMFRRDFSKPGSTLQLSSTVYWYQVEPHAPLPPMPSAADRAPAPEEPFWPEKEVLPSTQELQERGVKLLMFCGRPAKEVIFAAPGYGAVVKKGYAWSGWGLPVYFARADDTELTVELTVPQSSTGNLHVYIIDPDNFEGGRKQNVVIERLDASGQVDPAGRIKDFGPLQNFQEGRWLEVRIDKAATASGKLLVRATNLRKGSNAVVSKIEWSEK